MPKEKQVVALETKKLDRRNELNNLTNAQWMYFSRSAWLTTYPNDVGFELRKLQGGNKSPRLMADIVNFFTKSGEKVLDPMSGVGGTLLGSALAGRKAAGIEINREWIEVYNRVCREERIQQFPVTAADCLAALDQLKTASFDFVVVDPPYREDTKWDRTMCNNTHASRAAGLPERYSTSANDFGNASSYEDYASKILLLSQKIRRVLKPAKYYVAFAKDEYQDGEFRERSTAMAEIIRRAGFQWKGKITWYQAGAKLRPYGIPYSYVPNITDQKILVFKS